MEYKIVSAESEKELESLVNLEIKNGFAPILGGFSVNIWIEDYKKWFRSTPYYRYTQAMIKT